MSSFLDAAIAYPTAIYTTLLGVVLLYWLLALIGVVDLDLQGAEHGLHVDVDGGMEGLGGLASFVVAFGLSGVPFSIVLGLLVVISWTVCCLGGMWLLPWVPGGILHGVAATVLLLLSLVLALPITALLLQPLKGLFVTHNAVSNAALVGQRCKVLTTHVGETFGQAEVSRRGAPINIDVGAQVPNSLKRDSVALILDYDPSTSRYLIEPEI